MTTHTEARDESWPLFTDWAKTFAEDTTPADKPVAIVFYTAAGLREFVRELNGGARVIAGDRPGSDQPAG